MKRILIIYFSVMIGIIGIVAADYVATMDSADGSSAFTWRDSGSTVVASMDSDGNLQIKGGMVSRYTMGAYKKGIDYSAASLSEKRLV